VDNSEYTEWELGYRRDTTNEEYRQKYRAIYEQITPYETVYRSKTTDGQHPHITTLVPVKNAEGDVAAILCMQRPIRELREARRPYVINIGISTLVLAVLALTFRG
jgi:sigma-B regulation protein RsbU (phosphoserine phosphatase)